MFAVGTVDDFTDIDSLKTFLQDKGRVDCTKKLDSLTDEFVRCFIDNINAIKKDYISEEFRSRQEGAITSFSRKLDELIERCKSIQLTYRYRMKSTERLLLKIIVKHLDAISGGSNSEKVYAEINVDNYYKIITDLIGFRLLYRYPQEWNEIDKCLRIGIGDNPPLFVDDKDSYLNDRLSDYSDNPNRPSFIAELPIWFRLDTKQVELATAISHSDFRGYEHRDELPVSDVNISKRFRINHSRQGYRSLHYVINLHGRYVELQARTLFDEAWAECGHDLVYKFPQIENNELLRKEYLGIYSITLAHQMGVGRDIAEQMYTVFSSNQHISDSQYGLHRILSGQIRVSGDLNSRVASLLKFPIVSSEEHPTTSSEVYAMPTEQIVAGEWVKNIM